MSEKAKKENGKGNGTKGKKNAKKETVLTASAIKEKRLFGAYHGSRETQRALDTVTGCLFESAVVDAFIKGLNLPFTMAEARNGTIVRINTKTGDEAMRFFMTEQKKYKGMIGVSGKVKNAMESAIPDADFEWVKQDSKNYYYTHNTSATFRYIETLSA